MKREGFWISLTFYVLSGMSIAFVLGFFYVVFHFLRKFW